ncbi:MAG TPA: putative Ig domain-containing protein [Candidatus Acidoferrales bacterium]|nr:putative Ig domain-containing protein [Candidatus Acidoferrales bacterium]
MAIQKTYAHKYKSLNVWAENLKHAPVHMSSLRFIALLFICAALIVEAGCHKGSITAVTVNINPSATQFVDSGHSLNFTATLAGDTTNKGVKWSLTLNGNVCSSGTGAGCGTLSNATNTSVTYTAPSVSSQASFTLTATSVYDPVITSNVTITVNIAPQFTTTSIPTGAMNGVPYTATVAAQYGTAPLTYYIDSGSLPAGLTLNPNSGQIVGTPTFPGPGSQTSNFVVQVKDFNGSIAATPLALSITVAGPPPLSASASLPQGFIGAGYSGTIASNGGVTPLSFGVSSGSLPGGLTLNSNSGQITGTPTTTGTSSFTVSVTDSAVPTHQSASVPGSITVSNPPAFHITTTSVPNGATAAGYSALLQAQGGIPPYTWTLVSGQLPAGLTLSSQSNNTGLISGNPILAGTSTFTVQVTDSDSVDTPQTATLPITIATGTNTNSLFNGTYTFFFQGFDAGGPVSIAGTLTSDGNGNITSGFEDSNRTEGIVQNARLSGTYSVGISGADGRGVLHLIAIPGVQAPLNIDYQIVLESDGTIRMIENNNTNTNTDIYSTHGAGVMRPVSQSTFTVGSLSGNYAFEFTGQDYNAKPAALAGVMHADGVNKLTPITSDINDGGTLSQLQSPSGTFSFTASDLRGTATLLYSLPGKSQTQLQFAFYFVSSSDVYFVETDVPSITDQFPRLSGEALLQQTGATFGASSLAGNSVVTGTGFDGKNSTVMEGLLTAATCDGTTAAVSLSYDQNAGGTISSVAPAASTCIIATNGRTTFGNLDSRFGVAYLTGPGQGFILGGDAAVTTGRLELQTPMSYTSSMVEGSYALSASLPRDTNTASTVGQLVSNGGSNPSLVGTLDEVDPPGNSAHLGEGLQLNVATLAANGRGTITDGPPHGFPANLVFYMISPSQVRMISIDPDPNNEHPDVIELNH